MRRPFIAGNWKMNLNKSEAVELATALVKETQGLEGVDVAVCPPSCYLDAVGAALGDSQVKLGAQNVYFEDNGAYTGELSTAMLLDVGCTYVVLGHSERRHVMGETDEDVNRKVKAALAAGLLPIVCVGETLPEREAGDTMKVIETQFTGSLAGLSNGEMKQIVIAYEPVWAIGTGMTASPEQAEEVHAALRKLMADTFSADVADSVRIQYGGSVKPDNAADLLSRPNIDGALVGGASLKAEPFKGIIDGAK
jgi:triosephosphate isomerase (TIM)